MDVRNCRLCGRIFNYIGGDPLCQGCMKTMDDKFATVKEYIYEHPGVGMQEVSEEMDVPLNQIKKWIREERLCFAEDSASGIECESCGAMIKTGRFCAKCKDNMANTLNSVYHLDSPISTKDKINTGNAKIRFSDR
ncbi:flagellar protein [Anaeromicropila herbilytica]|uniref:Flagellar protein n=1 Tax=Anaeromicropila herbilytica TaxID=2785025 RepID=A0A7R7IC84_9FIRM|nr:flagellar protein [Anaeromicropila herbilytica]BCN29644.1 hypothetical protein bsdtb5_09390 [Anaeromicropila herbilytica]